MSIDANDTYKIINRSAMVLEPTPEFLAWVKAIWPEDLRFKAFRKFFRPHFHAVVVDLAKGPIEAEP